jgi:hypothetical protein
VRLIVVDRNWKCTAEYLGELVTSSQVMAESGMTFQLMPNERVLSPVEAHEAQAGAVYWLLKRSPQGEVTLVPIPAGESVYFSKAEVDARSGGEEIFFPEMIAGHERWFVEVRAPHNIEDDGDGELTYDEDGERSQEDSLGPADTIIVDFDRIS